MILSENLGFYILHIFAIYMWPLKVKDQGHFAIQPILTQRKIKMAIAHRLLKLAQWNSHTRILGPSTKNLHIQIVTLA